MIRNRHLVYRVQCMQSEMGNTFFHLNWSFLSMESIKVDAFSILTTEKNPLVTINVWECLTGPFTIRKYFHRVFFNGLRYLRLNSEFSYRLGKVVYIVIHNGIFETLSIYSPFSPTGHHLKVCRSFIANRTLLISADIQNSKRSVSTPSGKMFFCPRGYLIRCHAVGPGIR